MKGNMNENNRETKGITIVRPKSEDLVGHGNNYKARNKWKNVVMRKE